MRFSFSYCPACGKLNIHGATCICGQRTDLRPQGTATGRTAPPATEGLKTASRAVTEAHSDSDDPTEENA